MFKKEYYLKVEKWVEQYLIKGSGIITISLLLLILFFMLKDALPFLLNDVSSTLFTTTIWSPLDNKYGILSIIYGSFLVTFIALIITVPTALATALFLSEIAPKTLRNILKVILELFSAIPSVVFGFIGVVFLAPSLKTLFGLETGLNAFTAAVLLSSMALPTIASIADESLQAVPPNLKEASLALGATKIQTMLLVTFPSASSGILAAIILGFGRIVGETMAVMMITGGTPQIVLNIFKPIRTMTGTIASEMGEVVHGDPHYQSLFLIGSTLFFITLGINVIAKRLTKKKIINNYS